MEFEAVLYEQLQALDKWSVAQARLVRLIEHAPLGTTPRAVTALEERVKWKMGLQSVDAVDWSKLPSGFNWQQILALIEKLLPLILALFGL